MKVLAHFHRLSITPATLAGWALVIGLGGLIGLAQAGAFGFWVGLVVTLVFGPFVWYGIGTGIVRFVRAVRDGWREGGRRIQN